MLNSIQLLRAFAAWLVVFHHYIQIFYGFNNSNPVSYFLSNYGALGVDLFFVISGFVIFLSADGKNITPKTFALQRIARIVPAYWIFTCISALTILYAPGILIGAKYDSLFMIRSLLFIPTDSPAGLGIFPLLTVGWTLNYEVLFYAVFLFALYLPKSFRVPAIFIGIVFAQQLLPKIGGAAEFYGHPIVFEFLLGIVSAIAFRRGWLSKIPAALAIIISLIAVTVIYTKPSAEHDPILIGIPCALIMLSMLSQERLFRESIIIKKLADWSYSTYLCHPIVIFLMLKAYRDMELNPALALALTITLIVIVSWASYKFIERPAQLFVKRRKTRSTEDRRILEKLETSRLSGPEDS